MFTLLFTACVLIGGTKTNSPPMGLMVPLPPPLPQSVVQTVTDEDIARGYSEVAETNCEASVYAMPEGITPSFNWHKRGTFGEWARLDLGDFAFPLGTNDGAVTSFSVFNDGRIRPTPRDAAREICAVGAPMLAMQGASRFWTADGASGSKLLTWENFFLNADTNTPVNAQIELFQNGDFTTRSNALERIYRRVAYFDWDGDGLENTVDPDPLVAGADAHGTNAEWYNVMCSNIVNSNAYYFVDVVATNGPAPIYFTGDRESRLGNPVVVALGGETNHVPLLIGIDYAITSPVPFTVSFPNDGFATVTTNGVANYEIRWPLEFCVSPDGNGGFYTSAIPYDPGGEFSWSASGDGLNMRGASACSYTSVSNWIGFTCGTGGNCGCDGCSVDGTYSVENAEFATPSLWCGCCASESVGTNDPPSAPSVSVSFDKAVVFYEDAYTNAPNDVVAKYSTNVTLTVSAYGGEAGGMLYVSEQNIGKLVRTGGKAIAFPYTAFVPPQSGVSFSIEYEAETHSDSEGDIAITASITPGDGGGIISNSTSTTAMKVLVTPEWTTGGDFVHRHYLGVCEGVWCEAYPSGLGVLWTCHGNGTITPNGSFHRHFAPFSAGRYMLTIEKSGCQYSLPMQSFFPNDIEVLDDSNNPVLIITNAMAQGEAGGVGLVIPLYCSPTNVSFSRIEVRELPTPAHSFTQYFATAYWDGLRDHQGSAISSGWFAPNHGNYFGNDEASIGPCPQPWLGGGSLEWRIPNACRPINGPDVTTNIFKTTQQNFWISESGTVQVMKFGYMVERTTNGTVNAWRLNAN